MKFTYTIPILCVLIVASTGNIGAVTKITPEQATQVRQEFDAGLAKVVAKDLQLLEDTLAYAREKELKMYQDCIKRRGAFEGKQAPTTKLCELWNNTAKSRSKNVDAVARAKRLPLSFARNVLHEVIVNERRVGSLPPVQNHNDAMEAYRGSVQSLNEYLEIGDLSRGEVFQKTEQDIVRYVDDFVSKKAQELIPNIDENALDKLPSEKRDDAKMRTAYDRLQTENALKNILGIPKPKGAFAKWFDRAKAWFGAKPPYNFYANDAEQLVGTPTE